jgi:hypothetical protein
MLSVIMLNVVMLNVIMPSVVALIQSALLKEWGISIALNCPLKQIK